MAAKLDEPSFWSAAWRAVVYFSTPSDLASRKNSSVVRGKGTTAQTEYLTLLNCILPYQLCIHFVRREYLCRGTNRSRSHL